MVGEEIPTSTEVFIGRPRLLLSQYARRGLQLGSGEAGPKEQVFRNDQFLIGALVSIQVTPEFVEV